MKLQNSELDSDGIKNLLQERLWHAPPDQIAEMEDLVANLDDYEFVPDPNDHVRMMGKLTQEIFPRLMRRHWYLGVVDEPVLITCDEPVMVTRATPVRFGATGCSTRMKYGCRSTRPCC